VYYRFAADFLKMLIYDAHSSGAARRGDYNRNGIVFHITSLKLPRNLK
jgi:hypothetical protein